MRCLKRTCCLLAFFRLQIPLQAREGLLSPHQLGAKATVCI